MYVRKVLSREEASNGSRSDEECLTRPWNRLHWPMKVRLTSDSLRFRLDQTDAEALSSTGVVEFELGLDGTGIRCALEVDEHARSVEATCSEREIVVLLPADRAERWLSTDEVGLEEQVESEGRPVQVLVEKDLGCRHGKESEEASSETETFDHLRD